MLSALKARPHCLSQREGRIAEFHFLSNRCSFLRQQRPVFSVLRRRRLEPAPQPGGRAHAHQLTGIEPESAQRPGPADYCPGFVEIQPGWGKGDFEREPCLARGAASGMRFLQGPSGTLAFVDFLGIAVETDLYGPDRQPGEARGDAGIETLAIGLDLETHARRAQRFGKRQEMRHHQRLAAAQHHVRNLVAGDIGRDPHGLLDVQFIGQALAGSRIGAAMQASKVAIARDLPGNEQRRPQAVDPVRHQYFTRTPAPNRLTATK